MNAVRLAHVRCIETLLSGDAALPKMSGQDKADSLGERVDSALSSASTVVVTDMYRRFKSNVSDTMALRKAKQLTILLGVIGTGSALILAALEVPSLLD